MEQAWVLNLKNDTIVLGIFLCPATTKFILAFQTNFKGNILLCLQSFVFQSNISSDPCCQGLVPPPWERSLLSWLAGSLGGIFLEGDAWGRSMNRVE